MARFVSDWGIDPPYAEKAVRLIAGHAQRIALPEAAAVLGRFLRENEDCNAQAIREDILAMLREIVQVEGRMDVTEDQALAEIDRILRLETEPSLRRTTGQIAQRLGQGRRRRLRGSARARQRFRDRHPGRRRGKGAGPPLAPQKCAAARRPLTPLRRRGSGKRRPRAPCALKARASSPRSRSPRRGWPCRQTP
ncbi:hypothetical protein [Rhodobacter capsulatus]|uniref:hypothetical protein n=1 Tax=Rhodobacter capsulatus TaxID=1061 RepID=UPI004026123A